MRPTTSRLVVTLAVLGAAAGWGLSLIVQGWTGRSVPVPILAGSALWLLAIALLAWGMVIKPRLGARVHPDRHPGVQPLPVLVAARVAAISLAATRMGALVAGLYGGVAGATLAGGMSTPASQQTLLAALLAATGAAATSIAALRLERWCLVPHGNDDSDR